MNAPPLKQSSMAALSILALLLAGCSSGSSTPATRLAGTVTSSSSGSALDEFISLLFTPSGGGTTTTATTDAAGTYSVDLAAGTYTVAATRPGYVDFSQSGVVVTAEQTTTLDIAMVALPPNTYITSAACSVCHEGTYTTFRQTGHPYKINKVIGGVAPTYPFTALPSDIISRITDDDVGESPVMPGTDNTLGTPGSWNDVSYVIGGFAWKARFMDANGYIVTGTSVQYNYATDAMVSYHNNDVDKPFNCGNCHTTGWQHYDATINPNRQGSLPGIDGTFAEQGIGCEACHGAGSLHAQTKNASDITHVATPRTAADFNDGSFAYGKAIACGECHTRDGERDYSTFKSAFDLAREGATPALPLLAQGGRVAASGGLVKHHEQYDEILGIDPATLETTRSAGFLSAHGNCMNCHSPHKAGVFRDNAAVTKPGLDDSNSACLACHDTAKYDPENNLRGSMKTLTCVTCHMPDMAKSAVKTTLLNGKILGDVASHMFKIDLSGAPQFTAAGDFANPYITGDFACLTCHTGDTANGQAFALTSIPTGFDYHPN